MGAVPDVKETERLVVGLVNLVGAELPELRPADLGLLIEVFLVLKMGNYEARSALLRHLEMVARVYPGEGM